MTDCSLCINPWYQVAFGLATGVNNAYVLGYSGSVMAGLVALSAWFLLLPSPCMQMPSLHASMKPTACDTSDTEILLATFYGRKAYALTWALQYINLFTINTGFIILDGQASKPPDFAFWADATITCNSRDLPAHCCVLSARSPFFREFPSKNREKSDLLGDFEIGYEALVLVMEYIYSGRVGQLPKEVCICVDEACPAC